MVKIRIKKIQFKQHLATTFKPLTKKIMILVYLSAIWVHLSMLAPTDTFIHKLPHL